MSGRTVRRIVLLVGAVAALAAPAPAAAAPQVVIEAPAPSAETGVTPTFGGSAGAAPGDASEVVVRVFPGERAEGDPAAVATAQRAGDRWSVRLAEPLEPGQYTARAEQDAADGSRGRSLPVTFSANASPEDTGGGSGGGSSPFEAPPDRPASGRPPEDRTVPATGTPRDPRTGAPAPATRRPDSDATRSVPRFAVRAPARATPRALRAGLRLTVTVPGRGRLRVWIEGPDGQPLGGVRARAYRSGTGRLPIRIAAWAEARLARGTSSSVTLRATFRRPDGRARTVAHRIVTKRR